LRFTDILKRNHAIRLREASCFDTSRSTANLSITNLFKIQGGLARKRVLWLLVLVAAVLLNAASLQAADNFYVIATGPPTVGTKITSLPYTITASGYYYLTGNLSYAGGNAITVNNDNVTIDLMGFSLIGPSNSSLYSGIYMNGRKNVEVRNGTVSGWHLGVSEYSNAGSHHRMIGVRANGNRYGIYLNGTDHLIKGCIASQGTFGSGSGLVIGTGTIGGCTAMNFIKVDSYSGFGIFIGGGTASGNVVANCTGTSAIGIYAIGSATISHNQVSNCTTGINGAGGGSIIGNVVYSDTGQTGIVPSTNINPNVLDQNTSSGAGTHYGPGTGVTVWGLNGG